jgi:hypothetical protein
VDILSIYDSVLADVAKEPERLAQPSSEKAAEARAAMARDLSRRDLAVDPVTEEETDVILSTVFAWLAMSATPPKSAQN